jgi:IS5 family transposase
MDWETVENMSADRTTSLSADRRALPDTPKGRLDDLIETAMAHIRAKGEHPFRCTVNVLAALANLFKAHHLLRCKT